MYKKVELYDGTSANIKTQDLNRLERVLEIMSKRMGQLGKVTPQTNLEYITLRAGMATAKLFMESQLPTTTKIGFRDGQVHPVRSMGYYGMGGFMLRLNQAVIVRKQYFNQLRDILKTFF